MADRLNFKLFINSGSNKLARLPRSAVADAVRSQGGGKISEVEIKLQKNRSGGFFDV